MTEPTATLETSPLDSNASHLLQRKVESLTRLVEISVGLSSTLRLKALLARIMDAAAELVDADAASVLLWDSNTQELRFAATTTASPTVKGGSAVTGALNTSAFSTAALNTGLLNTGVLNTSATTSATQDAEATATSRSLIGMRVPLDNSIAGTVMQENRIVVVNAVQDDPRHYRQIDQQTEYQTRSILGVPMRSKNKVIGVLEAINKKSGIWTEDDATYLTILAAQAATAIEGAQMVQQLQRANEELSQVDKLKSDFIAIASHELRTPLGVILGYASFLQETEDAEVRGLADKVVGSALQLRRIIEDLTNLRYLEQGSADLQKERISLLAFLTDVLTEQKAMVQAQGHRLRLVTPPDDVQVELDRVRMGMVLENLLNNAVRFTPPGGTITVEATLPSAREVWLRVHDTGIGLPSDKLETIFDRFIQLEDHMTRHHGGLGIGLSIARALAEAHGGRAWAESAGVNAGSTFTISIPLEENGRSQKEKARREQNV